MKILVVAPTPYFSDRGCHVRILEEAICLRDFGHQVEICAYHLGRDVGGFPIHRIPRIPWYCKVSAGPSWHKLYLDMLLLITCWRAARNMRPDILHVHLHEGAFIGAFLKKIFGLPMVFDCQGSLSEEIVDHDFIQPKSWLFRGFRLIEKWINRQADHIVTSSTPTAALLCQTFGVYHAGVTALGDGVDVEVFRPGISSPRLRQSLSLPEGKALAVFLGAMTEYQGLDILLEAIRLIDQKKVPVHFLLMGYPEEQYQRKARSLEIAHRVTFTGRIEYSEVPEHLCLGDFALSPKISRTEANGKLLNYMACGLPTIVFDAPVNREILGETGVYAEYGSASSLAQKIQDLVQNHPLRESYARAVRERAVRKFSWEKIGRRLEGILSTQISGSPNGAKANGE